MDSESRNQGVNPKRLKTSAFEVVNPKRLKTLAFEVAHPGGNNLLHKFVLDNSHPNESGSEIYVNAVLLSMRDVPAIALNARNDDAYNALELAVMKNNLTMVRKLLSCFVNIDVNASCLTRRGLVYGETALHLAAELGNLSIIQELLDRGAAVDVKTNFQDTALCYALRPGGRLDAVKLLVSSRGANVNIRCGWHTPLCLAACFGNLEKVEFLVNSGAEVNFREGWSPLCCAVRSKNLAVVEFLVNSGAEVNAAEDAGHHDTPLHAAVMCGSLEIVQFLVGNHADVNAKNGDNNTPLHLAALSGSLEIVEFLAGNRADINAENNVGQTPLDLASNQPCIDALQNVTKC